MSKKFIEIVVEYPDPAICIYPEYKGKPYFSIRYEENGEKFEGFGTYNPEVLSEFICEYFMAKKGKWIKKMRIIETDKYASYTPEWYCSCCGEKYAPYIAELISFCPNCGADMREDKTMDELKWHKYPEEQPNKEGRYLVCYPLGTIPPTPIIFIARWGRSEGCEWRDKSLKRKNAYWYDIDYEHGDYAIDNVYAWMPLPEPMLLPDNIKETKDE